MPAIQIAARAVVGALLLFWLSVGQAQIALVSPSYIDFGEIKMGAQVTVPVLLRNLTATPLELGGGGFNTTNGFSSNSGTCTGTTIPAHGSCAFTFIFRPLSATQTVENATFIHFSGGGESMLAPIAVRGTGGESLVQVTPRSIDFGEELIGEMVTVPVTITNTHSAMVQSIGGGIGPPFSATTSCGSGIAAGASCHYFYSFIPGQVNEVVGNTSISFTEVGTDLSHNFISIQLRGRGRTTAGPVHVTPVALDFGDIKIGSAVQATVFSTNRTASTMTQGGGGFNDDDNAFSTVSIVPVPGCNAGLQPPQVACSTVYGFLPRERRGHAASTHFGFSQPPDFYQVVPLSFSGNGVGTLARISPVAVDFGDIPPGILVSVPVTIRNTSPVTLSNFLGGNVTGAFSRTTTCGTSLAAGASCTINYRFQSWQAGHFQATTIVSYQGNGAVETTQITLSGTSGSPIFMNGFE